MAGAQKLANIPPVGTVMRYGGKLYEVAQLNSNAGQASLKDLKTGQMVPLSAMLGKVLTLDAYTEERKLLL